MESPRSKHSKRSTKIQTNRDVKPNLTAGTTTNCDTFRDPSVFSVFKPIPSGTSCALFSSRVVVNFCGSSVAAFDFSLGPCWGGVLFYAYAIFIWGNLEYSTLIENLGDL